MRAFADGAVKYIGLPIDSTYLISSKNTRLVDSGP